MIVSGTTKIFLGLGLFAAVGSGILGYGVYRKHVAGQERQAAAREAHRVCEISPMEFARRSPEVRAALLAEAQGLTIAIETDSKADQTQAEALKAWRESRTKQHERLDLHERNLANCLVRLAFSFPSHPDEQLRPEKVMELNSAVAAAKSTADKLTAEVKAGREYLSPSMQERLSEVTARITRVDRELASRRQAFTGFVERIERRLEHKFVGGASLAEDLARWQFLGANDPASKTRLRVLGEKLKAATAWLRKEQELRLRLGNIIAVLQEATGSLRSEKTIEQCDGAIKEARNFGTPACAQLADRAERARAAASSRQSGAGHPFSDEFGRLTDDIIPRMLALHAAAPEDRAEYAAEISVRVARMKAADDRYGQFFQSFWTKMKRASPELSGAKPAYTYVYMPPPGDWSQMQRSKAYLEAARKGVKGRTAGPDAQMRECTRQLRVLSDKDDELRAELTRLKDRYGSSSSYTRSSRYRAAVLVIEKKRAQIARQVRKVREDLSTAKRLADPYEKMLDSIESHLRSLDNLMNKKGATDG